MRASRGEIKIEEILKEAELSFKEEYSFPDLNAESGRPYVLILLFLMMMEIQILLLSIKENSIMKQVRSLVVKKVFISKNIMIIKKEDSALYMDLI